VAQAEASLALFDVQSNKLTARAPQDGTIMAGTSRSGKVLAPAQPCSSLAGSIHSRITVYLPETTYGQVKLGKRRR